jgi:hypothetical protein
MGRANIAAGHYRGENWEALLCIDGDDTPFKEPLGIQDCVVAILSLCGPTTRPASCLEFNVYLRRLHALNEDGQKQPRLGFDDDGTLRNKTASERIISMALTSP